MSNIMDKHIPNFYREYGRYINKSRAFPFELDGLKPVERRVLLAAYENCRDKYIKSAKLSGVVIGQYHPHGDLAAYGTIVQLVHQNFLDGQGNFGSNIGVSPCEAAASRYTEIRLNDNIKNSVFELINYVDRVESEMDPEPPFLPTMYPLCLMGTEYTLGIGFGYRTLIPCYTKEDLKKRLMFLLGYSKKEPVIKPVTDCDIISDNNVLNELLKSGKSVIEFKGKYTVDSAHNKIYIKSIPPGRTFEKIFSKLDTELSSGEIGYADLSEKGETNILFEVTRQRNRDEIFKKLVDKIDNTLCGSVSFEIIVVDQNGRVKNISVDDLLLTVFKNYKMVTERGLNAEINKIRSKIAEYDLINKIKPHLGKYLKTDQDYNAICHSIAATINADEDTLATIMTKYTIKKLLTVKFDINLLIEEENILRKQLTDIENYVKMKY